MIVDPGPPATEPTRFLTLTETRRRMIADHSGDDPSSGPSGHAAYGQLPDAIFGQPARIPLSTGPPTPDRRPAHLRPVINATGVLLHDGLGRAPLSPTARTAIDAAAATCDVELDLATGRRSRRGSAALVALAATVPAARSVHVVNNNAGGLMLAAMALAGDREIVISRGELVETADGFRLPELLTAAGARLREVGTTNRTTLGDYAEAIGPRTGFVLRLYPSSYRVVGLTSAPALTDLAELCARRGTALLADPGSGLLTPDPALPDEPDVSTWLRDGASLVMTSGDKLLGGPQCGLVLGRADLVDRMRRHPLARALRVDKLTLAALEATLRSDDNPVRRSLHADANELRSRAERLASWLRGSGVPASAVSSRAVVTSDGVDDTGHQTVSERRGGTLAGAFEPGLPSAAVALDAGLAAPLRRGRPSVLGRVEQDCCLLDLRSVPSDLDPVLAATVLAVASGLGSGTTSGTSADGSAFPVGSVAADGVEVLPPDDAAGPLGTDTPRAAAEDTAADGTDALGNTGTARVLGGARPGPAVWAHAPSWAQRTDRVPTGGWAEGRAGGWAGAVTASDADEVTLQ